MTNAKHADAFFERLLDMLGHTTEKEPDAKEGADEVRRPRTEKQGRRVAIRTTPKRKRPRGR